MTKVLDGYGQITNESVSLNSSTHSSFDQTWDLAGRRSTLNAGVAYSYGYRADGAMTKVVANGETYNFLYNTAGLLNVRANRFRTASVQSRDALGRSASIITKVGAGTPLAESFTWRADSTLDDYTADRSGVGTWDETRDYSYNNRGRLTSETYAPASGQSKTINYEFDGNTTGGVGVRTKASVTSLWSVTADPVNPFKRVTGETASTQAKSILAGGQALGAQTVSLSLDSNPVANISFDGPNGSGAWSAPLKLTAGSHTLSATATHPSGHQATANSNFTVTGINGTISTAYDVAGNTITRTLSGGKTQTLKWDGRGRLKSVSERDGSNDGYDWIAIYDGLGRRIKTTYQLVDNNVPDIGKTVLSFYDPEVEFLEIGLNIYDMQSWLVYGPDASGVYGGLQGIGGLEAILDDYGNRTGVLNDYFGNAVGMIGGGTVAWNEVLSAGYGPLPGETALTFAQTLDIKSVIGWRGHRLDETGFIYMGARHYEPNGGRFLSTDPLGHESDMSLYAYAGGDPVNSVDPDGRVATKFTGVAVETKTGINANVVSTGIRVALGISQVVNIWADQQRQDSQNIRDVLDYTGVLPGPIHDAVRNERRENYPRLSAAVDFAELVVSQPGTGGGPVGTVRTLGAVRNVRAAETAALRIAPYDDLTTVAGGQRHHLNQTAAYRDVIPRGQGLSVEMQGNILRDANAPHTLAHRSMEGFWNTFRGTDIVPTNLQYTRALQQSLRAAGMPEAEVRQAVQAAIRERVSAGLLGGMELPRVPGPIRNIAE